MKILTYLKLGTIFVLKSPFKFIKYFLSGIKAIIITFPFFLINQIFNFFKKNKSPKKLIPKFMLLLSLTTYLLCIYTITRWYVQTERNKNFTDSLLETETFLIKEEATPDEYVDEVTTTTPTEPDTTNEPTTPSTPSTTTSQEPYFPSFLNVDLNYYINKNFETVGWIKIDGTKINYPIVQHTDNKYYLEHDFYNKQTSVGWIYSDYRNNFENFNNNTVIYGHNLINKTMFGQLPNFLNKSWLNNTNQHYIRIASKNSNTIWQIFSVYTTAPVIDYLQTNFTSIESYQNFLNTIKAKSVHKIDMSLDYTDKIITLSTCDNTGTKRVAIHAKLISIQTK